MKVKLYTANSMQEAMNQVKNELGLDAVILHTRRFSKGGFLGFFSKEVFEVMVGIDTKILSDMDRTPEPSIPEKLAEPTRIPVVESTPIVPTVQEAGPTYFSEYTDEKVTALQVEMATMREMLEQVLCKIPQVSKPISPLMNLLIKNDIDVEIAESLIKGLPDDKLTSDGEPSRGRQMLFERIINCFKKVDGIAIPELGAKKVALIGPTGVGKTTTIAKLAANFAVKEGYKIALITADTYRISAVEQLKTYADIIGVPIEVVYTAYELKSALYRHSDKQLILIDTAGRSPRNQEQLADLQELLEIDPDIETHLVLSTTTKYKDALEVVNKFSVCAPQKFLFTKIDEASNIGTMLNLLYQFPSMLSYVTNGQNVPDDIELASPDKLANLILRD